MGFHARQCLLRTALNAKSWAKNRYNVRAGELFQKATCNERDTFAKPVQQAIWKIQEPDKPRSETALQIFEADMNFNLRKEPLLVVGKAQNGYNKNRREVLWKPTVKYGDPDRILGPGIRSHKSKVKSQDSKDKSQDFKVKSQESRF